MTKAILCYINHVEVGDQMTWNMTTEELLGGVGRATLNVQDRTNAWEPECHWDVKLVIASSGWVLFRGEINSEPVELITGHPWRTWVLDCSDYSGELPYRLVGAVDGQSWLKIDQLGDYIPIDPFANTLGTDYQTIQVLFDHYIRVDGEAIETTTYVSELLPEDSFQVIYWTVTTLKGALDDLAALVVSNLQYWIDPDLNFHWAAIPAWQDLAVGGAGGLALLFPEMNVTLTAAPVELSGNVTLAPGEVGIRDIKFTFDGSQMAEQVYVKGGTGFTYDDGVEEIVTEPPTVRVKYPGRYSIVVNTETEVWRRLSSGYIDPHPHTIDAGTTVYADYIQVPWNAATHKGGMFYKMVTGPMPGWLFDNDTNYFGYGNITITKLPAYYEVPGEPPPPPPTPVPTIGVGGTGWTNSVLQDPNKRQVYLEAPASTEEPIRNAFGSQVIYRGRYPTLRGSLKVSGVDGWRVGQIVRISDDRMPAALNGKYFVIQRVSSSLFPETDVREYVLDWGDGATQRISASGPRKPYTPPPAVQLVVTAIDLTPEPSTTQTITAQMSDNSGAPWKIADKAVHWELLAYDLNGDPVTAMGTLAPVDSFTDRDGKAYTAFTSGARRDIQYFVYATTPVL